MTLPLGFIQNIGPTQLVLVLVIVLLLFGSSKLPDLARSLGRSLGEFKKGREEGEKLANEKVKEIVDDLKKEEPEKVEGPKA
ncbi:MAG: twin-arginine translocase TatA/TatE family subunit [Kiritimatiellae bacterium]|nr:twin-arginine translocase TatA/TatE family subunit [Kiritimatiellia bacterium]MDD3544450.1 twin-arginine translocase TatA/TatE family subunit [Kiritimatiellia bacterium]MDD4024440.1 twin-arginine translocase TatA/TatE family subunit [Kiritimatiellia bacterium]MDD4621730.1 twin-arginine translocase TatA/TatE family subunit [Kiritimatiellia bacterium]